jgi:hypothetical protein
MSAVPASIPTEAPGERALRARRGSRVVGTPAAVASSGEVQVDGQVDQGQLIWAAGEVSSDGMRHLPSKQPGQVAGYGSPNTSAEPARPATDRIRAAQAG